MAAPIDCITDEMLAAYVDGELGPAQMQEVARHLARDAEARRKVSEMREVNALLRAAYGQDQP